MLSRKPRPGDSPNWHEVLVDNLRIFVDCWKGYAGTEQAGAHNFLLKLLDYYMVGFTPGTIFEQHPVKIPRKGRQGNLFGDEEDAHAVGEAVFGDALDRRGLAKPSWQRYFGPHRVDWREAGRKR